MKPKMMIKIIVDALMAAAMMLLMGYPFFGDVAHEWIGAGAFVLFILHHILNLNFYTSLFRGKYTLVRIWGAIVDMLVLTAMLGLMVSGVMLSVHVFAFLPVSGGAAFARELHVAATHWGFILMALHLGLRWGMFIAMAKKAARIKKSFRIRGLLCFFIATGIAVYGAVVFWNRDFPTYMTLKTHFVFLDFEESLIRFYLDHLSLAGAFMWIGHYASKLLKKISSR